MAKLIINNRYGIVPNNLLNCPDISFKAKGLFAYIQSKPDNWNFSAKNISTQTKESIDAVRTGLVELEKHGYLVRTKFNKSGGLLDIEYTLYSEPIIVNPTTENPTTENPTTENTTTENPTTENPTTIVKKNLSKKDLINKVKYIPVSEFENISIEENKLEEFNSTYEKNKLEWMVKKLDSWLETKKKKCNGIRSFKAYCNNWVEESYNAQKVNNASQILENGKINKIKLPI